MSIAQIGWVLVAILPLGVAGTLVGAILLWIIELSGPIVAERRGMTRGTGSTPWHPHHIAERYSLLAIIALGETVLGTLAAAQAISGAEGWTLDAIVVIAAGVALTFALWWTYFLLPSAPILAVARERSFPWGYGHILVFASIAAVGAGLHVVGYVFDEHYEVSAVTAVLALAVPVVLYLSALLLLHAWLIRAWPRGGALQILAIALTALAVALAVAGLPLSLCILLVLAAPTTLVVGYEAGGWRTLSAQLDDAVERANGAAA